jgi:Spy/CpxP family protein refolding chaperone
MRFYEATLQTMAELGRRNGYERNEKMKTRIYAGLVVLATVAIVTGALLAEAAKPAAGEEQATTQPTKKANRFAEKFEGVLASLDLDDEKEAKVLELVKQHGEAMNALHKEHRDRRTQLRQELKEATEAARTQQRRARQIHQNIGRMNTARHELRKQFIAQLSEQLDAEQMAEVQGFLAELRPPLPLGRMLKPLRDVGLTDEQDARIREILSGTREQIMEVLTEEQREKLGKELQRGRKGRGGGPERGHGKHPKPFEAKAVPSGEVKGEPEQTEQ